MTIETTVVKQEGNEVLGTKEKNLYYLIIKNKKGGKLVVNVGEKTHKEVSALNEEEKIFLNKIAELKANKTNANKTEQELEELAKK